MAYSEELADRIRAELAKREDVIEKKMFGGIAFMVAGSMAVGIIGKDLMARVGRDRHARALARPHVELMTFTGRPLSGFVLVRAKGIGTRSALAKWVDECVDFALTLSKSGVAGKKPQAARGSTPARIGTARKPRKA